MPVISSGGVPPPVMPQNCIIPKLTYTSSRGIHFRWLAKSFAESHMPQMATSNIDQEKRGVSLAGAHTNFHLYSNIVPTLILKDMGFCQGVACGCGQVDGQEYSSRVIEQRFKEFPSVMCELPPFGGQNPLLGDTSPHIFRFFLQNGASHG